MYHLGAPGHEHDGGLQMTDADESVASPTSSASNISHAAQGVNGANGNGGGNGSNDGATGAPRANMGCVLTQRPACESVSHQL